MQFPPKAPHSLKWDSIPQTENSSFCFRGNVEILVLIHCVMYLVLIHYTRCAKRGHMTHLYFFSLHQCNAQNSHVKMITNLKTACELHFKLTFPTTNAFKLDLQIQLKTPPSPPPPRQLIRTDKVTRITSNIGTRKRVPQSSPNTQKVLHSS